LGYCDLKILRININLPIFMIFKNGPSKTISRFNIKYFVGFIKPFLRIIVFNYLYKNFNNWKLIVRI